MNSAWDWELSLNKSLNLSKFQFLVYNGGITIFFANLMRKIQNVNGLISHLVLWIRHYSMPYTTISDEYYHDPIMQMRKLQH